MDLPCIRPLVVGEVARAEGLDYGVPRRVEDYRPLRRVGYTIAASSDNSPLEVSLKKSMEEHHDALARIEPGCWIIL